MSSPETPRSQVSASPEEAATAPKAVIFGCAGLTLGEAERDFFQTANPLGFILFANNCESPDQIRALTAALRSSVGRADALVLIDQEGGRVARLKPPHWRAAPAAAAFGTLFERDSEGALEAARLNARLIAADLDDIGIDVDCAPVLDVPVPGAHDVIGDRAFSASPETVAALGEAFCHGLLEGGIMPVLKHIPGHGRAMTDSHHELPVVNAPLEELRLRDFHPFKALGAQPFAMAAHVVYEAIDAKAPATVSRAVTDGVIRGELGFEGVLLSDDLSMEALKGSLPERAEAMLAGGCDVALHCSGKLDEMEAVAAACGAMSEAALARLARGLGMRRMPQPVDRAIVERRIDTLFGGGHKGGA